MRIIHVMECFAGGTFEFLSSLTQEMKDHEFIIIHGQRENTPPNYKQRFSESTVFIPWNNAQREISVLQDLKALIELVKILKKNNDKETIIHLHSSKAGLLGRIATWLLGIKEHVIYTTHGVSFLRKDTSKVKKNLYIALEKMGNCFGGVIVACSKSEGLELSKYGLKSVVVINNGIKIEQEEKYKKKLSEEIVIGTLGRITYQKNPILFNDISKLFLDDLNVKFLWIGDGELREKLNSNNIEITGWLNHENVKKYMKKIDVYFSTALWEGLPLAVLEAMELSKPLILSNCIGNKDLVVSGVNGYVFDDAQNARLKLKKLIMNDELIKMMGKKSRKIVAGKFSLKKMSDDYNSIYNFTKSLIN